MSDADGVDADRAFIVFVCRGCHADSGVYAINWLAHHRDP
jgi:hypothetical protein